MKFCRAAAEKMILVSLLMVFVWSWTVAGCALTRARRAADGVAPPPVATDGEVLLEAVPVEPRNVDERGYELGKRSTVEVGKPMIHRRLYGEEDTVAWARFLRSFEAHCSVGSAAFGGAEAGECKDPPLNELRARSGQTWAVSGIRAGSTVDAPTYLVSKHVMGGTLYLLVDASGNLIEGRNVAWRSADGPAPTSAGLGLQLVKLELPLDVGGSLVEFQHRHRVVRGP